MRVLLLQLDGKLPNIAIMRLAAHHRAAGDSVELRRRPTPEFGDAFDRVYASLIFDWSKPLAADVLAQWPGAIIGGTGWDETSSVEALGVTTLEQDYSLYPRFSASIGFTQRGCRLRCGFCVVPRKEGGIRPEQSVASVWRGDPWPRHLLLLDNDFFGQPEWPERIREIRDGGFKVSFCQGINARFLTDEAARALASVDYRDDGMKDRRLYTAWDNRKDEGRLFAGLQRLVDYGVKPSHIMVYMLIGYWPGETHAFRDYRREKLREFGAVPYPMPFVRTPELVGYQRWVLGAYDKGVNAVSWSEWTDAGYRPERLNRLDRVTHQDKLFPVQPHHRKGV